jgi:beta-glucosidase
VPEPPNQLQGFAKVTLTPGQTLPVTFTLTPRAFSYWNTGTHTWTVAGGDYRINVGDSSRDLPLTTTIRLAGARG